MGRRADPTELKIIKGNPGHRPIANVVVAGNEDPVGSFPKQSAKTRRALFNLLKKELPYARKTHTRLFEILAKDLFSLYEAEEAVDWLRDKKSEEGIPLAFASVGESEKNVHPLFSIVERLSKRVSATLIVLGATPTEQARMTNLAMQSLKPDAGRPRRGKVDDLEASLL